MLIKCTYCRREIEGLGLEHAVCKAIWDKAQELDGDWEADLARDLKDEEQDELLHRDPVEPF